VDHGAELPVFPVRNALLFPGMVAAFDVGRRPSLAAVDEVKTRCPPLLLVVAQKSPSTEDPVESDLHPVGCIAEVLNHLPNVQCGYRVILHGQERVALRGITRGTPYVCAKIARLPPDPPLTHPQRTLVEEIREAAFVLARAEGVSAEALEILERIREPENLVYLVAGNETAPLELKCRWLAAPLAERILLVLDEVRTQLAERTRASR
jgi:ATP-dependent Lon protease